MFQRNAFDEADTVATYKALIAFAIGLPAFILAKVLAPGFYANQDTKTPFKIAMVCIGVNLFFNLVLMGPLRHVGMALATSIAGWVNVVMMLVILRKRTWLVFEPSLFTQVGKIMAACSVMALILFMLRGYSDPYMHSGEILRTLVVVGVSVLGALGYFATGFACNTMNARTLVLKRLRRS
jgi:putative peptidoglycan lipid II flippase